MLYYLIEQSERIFRSRKDNMKIIKLKDYDKLIEYKGEMYTPKELEERLGVTGDFEIKVNEDGATWFEQAMLVLEANKIGRQ